MALGNAKVLDISSSLLVVRAFPDAIGDLSSAIVTAAFSAPVVSKSRVARCVVRAQADQSDALDLNRRAVLGAGAAVGAASMLPFAAPQPALANKVLSSDWELVSSA
jgi:hypothetical protein